jgi:exopolyphosphatase/guanosine-5'-triphosphate,3'-diphosphate pyrophosphatase
LSDHEPRAIVDIGSNSVRLVVYAGPARIPSVVFNEKVLAGLGQGFAETKALSEASQDKALAALERFRLLIEQMEVKDYRVVATAAVRDATNGSYFLKRVKAIGFTPEVISGEAEGALAGEGVLSAIPDADGIVGDLGGGSLELADIKDGRVLKSISLPFGVLRIGEPGKKTEEWLRKELRKALKASGLDGRGRGRPFYLVGGSWRTLARLDILFSGYPLQITHNYRMPPRRPSQLGDLIKTFDRSNPGVLASLTASRIPTMPAAKLVLAVVSEELRPSELIVSAFGIREGLLYHALTPAQRARDPLIDAARAAGRGLSRFGEHGDLLDDWIAPIFDDAPHYARIRRAACLLADVAWQAHPDFRAERGLDMALHGNWVGIDGPGRVMMAEALFNNFGGGPELPDKQIASLLTPRELERAALWGMAMRVGQRLSGGLATGLQRTRLLREGDRLFLVVRPGEEALYGETVEKRLKRLAAALGCKPAMKVGR